MATYDMPRAGVAGRSVWGRISNTVMAVFGDFATWNDRRMTRNALNGLTDRELDDIGLSRADVEMLGERR